MQSLLRKVVTVAKSQSPWKQKPNKRSNHPSPSPVEPSSPQLRQHLPRLRPQRNWMKARGLQSAV